MCACTGNGIPASTPARSMSLAQPEVENVAPRSETKTKGDLASRFRARSARSSSPSNGWVPVAPPLTLRRCKVPLSNSTSDHWSSHNSEARNPCLKATRIMVASLVPVALGGIDQLLDLALGQVFAWSDLAVRASDRSDCPIIFCRRYQSEMCFFHVVGSFVMPHCPNTEMNTDSDEAQISAILIRCWAPY